MDPERMEEGVRGLALRAAGPTSRRSFLKWGGAAAALAVGTAGCDDIFGGDDDDDDGVVLDFGTDFGVLNYAYALEQLEAAFYTAVVGAAGFATTFNADEQRVLRDLRDHEVAHREFFARAIPALGGRAIPALTPDLGAVNLANRAQVLQTAQIFEDLGVAAYNGAGKYLRSPDLLTIAGKIVSVEARHASAIRDLISPGTAAFAPNAFDAGQEPSQVLAAAGAFIVEPIRLRNAA
jgi:hypothetical protein